MMLLFYRVFPLVLIVVIAAGAFWFLRRLLRTWSAGTLSVRQTRALAVISVLIALPAGKITSMWTLFFLLLAGSLLLWEGLFAIGERVGKRRFPRLRASGIMALFSAIALMITGCLNASNIHATHYALDTALTKQYRILFLSDLHYPTTMDAAALEQLCARLSQEQADLLILGGDIVDENTSDEALSIVFEQLGAVKTTYGVYYVYGNHDTGSYAALSQRPKQLEQALAANDIRVLRDTSVRIDDELVVIGREDAKHPLDGQRADGAALLAQAGEGYQILIDHQPLERAENERLGVDLQLSGHTHNGQVFPIGMLSSLLSINEQTYGLQTIGDLTSIVSSGAGGWGYAFRNEGICEYVVVDLS